MVSHNVVLEPDIHQAAFYGDVRELQLALDDGQDVKSKDYTGSTAFHIAAANGHIQFIEFLLDKGYDVDDTDSNGRTALHLAAGNGHLETIKFLVSRGGNVKVESRKGRTVLGSAMCQVDRERQRHVIDYIKKCQREKMSWEID